EEFARALAARGDDLVVVARDVARCDGLAERLEMQHGVGVEVLPADLTTKKGRAAVEARLESTEAAIDLLVNNARMGTYRRVAELPRDSEEREIRLNVLAVVQVSRAALARMVRGGGGGRLDVLSPRRL